jgi:hypothetical protein
MKPLCTLLFLMLFTVGNSQDSIQTKLLQYKSLFDSGVINEGEFSLLKSRLLGVSTTSETLTVKKETVAVLSTDSVVPENTRVMAFCPRDIQSLYSHLGDSILFRVNENVYVNGKILIDTTCKILGIITELNGLSRGIERHEGGWYSFAPLSNMEDNGGGNLKIELITVSSVNGIDISLRDCYIYTTAQQNPYQGVKGAMIIKGTRKNCDTSKKTDLSK